MQYVNIRIKTENKKRLDNLKHELSLKDKQNLTLNDVIEKLIEFFNNVS